MNTPPLLLGCAALFWSWQTGQWLVGLAAALAIEAPRIAAARWDLQTADFNRIADLCSVLVMALLAYLYFSFGNPRAVTALFEWLPIVLLPLAAAQAWSTSREIDLSVLFRSLRRARRRDPMRLNLGYPYFALWLLGASAANVRTPAFYVVVLVLIAWPLALVRARGFRPLVWASLAAWVAALGYGLHTGLHAGQLWLEGAGLEWFDAEGERTDPVRSRTAIGAIGELKLSERIVLRVEAGEGFSAPILLHRASYDAYAAGAWVARNGRFEPLVADAGGTAWPLLPGVARIGLTVHDYAPRGDPVLSLPAGTVRVERLAAGKLQRNSLGTVQADAPPGRFSYRAAVDPEAAGEAPPSPLDLDVPATELPAVRRLAGELGLPALPAGQAVEALQRHFNERYRYELSPHPYSGRYTPLSEFLLRTRAGHCEYFATATVLLLRAAGIPARYATGFAAQERSRLEGAYLVRARHAHAWARAYIGGRWQDVDTTPAAWGSIEEARAPFWTPLADVVSWFRFRLASDSAGEDGGAAWRAALVLAAMLAAWMVWRRIGARRARPPEAVAARADHRIERSGLDSEFYLIERRIGELGWRRDATEPIGEWLTRLAKHPELDPPALAELSRLHYRHRFDPLGLPEGERARLRGMSFDWLARHPAPAR